MTAVGFVNGEIARPSSTASTALEQRLIDTALINLDGTDNKSRLGATTRSWASALPSPRAAAAELEAADLPLRRRPERARPPGADA